jgi:hypothetical protein
VTRYVTRERLHVDRIATAWAIKRFVDPEAEFEFVPRAGGVPAGAIPFDMRGVELGHRGGRCTFETLLELHELRDPGLQRMGIIIRGADLPDDPEAPPESRGVAAIFDGIRSAQPTDGARLEAGEVVCEALYRYCSGDSSARAV